MTMVKQLIIPLLLVFLLAGCGSKITCTGACGGDSRVCASLELSGKNRPELESVLKHYTAREDSLKLKAARFLIASMEGKSFYRFVLLDSLDNEHKIDVLNYPDYTAMVAAFDSVEAISGELHWDTCDLQPDLENITATYLIRNIDLAFEAWQNRPWSKSLNFDDFCDNVLPHRGSSEPLEPWRLYFMEKYADLPDRMINPEDPVEAATLINQDIQTWFDFDSRFYRHPTDQGLQEMISCGMGRCEDMTNLAIYAMRANALAVTSDYTPHWADSSNNHAWNSILVPGGDIVPFMGCLKDPGDYQLRTRMAKAYRKTYATNESNLYFQRRNEDEKLPGWLRGKSYTDVTTMYTPVADVVVRLPHAPSQVQFAYLCVFNAGEWKPIHWGEINNGYAVFTDMGTDICYLPMCFDDDELVPAGNCLILEKSGEVRELTGQDALVTTLRLASTTRRADGISTDTVEQAFFESGRQYELFFWNDEWESLGTQEAGDSFLVFENAPASALFWLVADESPKDERVFTWTGETQLWY